MRTKGGRIEVEQAFIGRPCYFGFVHPFRSCIGVDHDYHAVLSVMMSDKDWARYSTVADRAWNGESWDLEAVLALIAEFRPGVGVVRVDSLR